MKKFEYKRLSGVRGLHEIDINELGAEGWELISYTESGIGEYTYEGYIFKREIISENKLSCDKCFDTGMYWNTEYAKYKPCKCKA